MGHPKGSGVVLRAALEAALMNKVSKILQEDKQLFELTRPASNGLSTRNRTKLAGAARDYRSEEIAAQASLFAAMSDFRVERRSGVSHELVQIAHALILCGLPYRSTDATEHVRLSRSADGSLIRVTFYALGKDKEGKRIPMAYGSDRTLLHWCVDRAIKLKSNFVPLVSASDFMRDVGQTPTGPNYARLRAAYQRVSSMAIVVERFGATEDRNITPIMQASRLPLSIKPLEDSVAPIEGPIGIQFDHRFFNEFMRSHVPFPWAMLRTLNQKPQMQDYIVFLHWRSFAAKSQTLIPWSVMREQLWQDDSNPRRIRSRFAGAIKILRVAWPELNATADAKGLRIGPPAKGEHLIPAHMGETKLLNR